MKKKEFNYINVDYKKLSDLDFIRLLKLMVGRVSLTQKAFDELSDEDKKLFIKNTQSEQ